MRAAAFGRWWFSSKLALFGAVQCLVVPAPYELALADGDVLGRSPRFRVAGLLGLSVRLH